MGPLAREDGGIGPRCCHLVVMKRMSQLLGPPIGNEAILEDLNMFLVVSLFQILCIKTIDISSGHYFIFASNALMLLSL